MVPHSGISGKCQTSWLSPLIRSQHCRYSRGAENLGMRGGKSKTTGEAFLPRGNMICCRKIFPNTNLVSLSGRLHSQRAEGPNDFRASRVEPSTPAHLEPDRSSAVPSSTWPRYMKTPNYHSLGPIRGHGGADIGWSWCLHSIVQHSTSAFAHAAMPSSIPRCGREQDLPSS